MTTSFTLTTIGTIVTGIAITTLILTNLNQEELVVNNTTVPTIVDYKETTNDTILQTSEPILSVSNISKEYEIPMPQIESEIFKVIAEEVSVQAKIITPSKIDVISCRIFCCGGRFYLNETIEEEPIEEEEESLLSEQIVMDPYLFEAKAYPNPTRDNTTIELDIEMGGNFTIQLFDMNGRLVQQIYDGHLESGRQSFMADLYDYMPGLYFISIQSLFQQETLKIQKIG